MSPLVVGAVLVVFVKRLTADGKSRVQDCENLQLTIQMQLSLKRKGSSQFCVPFLKSTSNFKHFEKGMIVIGNAYLKLQTVKILNRKLSKQRRFRRRIDSQHVTASQILVKSP